jgi:hypothetical protein
MSGTDTPSARLIAAAAETMSVVDAEARTLVLRRLGALDKLRLFKAVGSLLSQNEPYLGMAMLACSVASIDGVPIPPPTNEAQVESLVSRLGDAGIAAAAAALPPVVLADAAAAKDLAGN